jgi:hypothetical protein
MVSFYTYIIGSKDNEPDRITYLENYFKSENMNVTYFQPWYKTNLTSEIIQKYVPINASLHDRPLRMSEISLFLNYIYLFEKILREYNDGIFLILESDVIFTDKLTTYMNTLLSVTHNNNINYDCISIGAGCKLTIPGVDSNSKNFCFMQTEKTRATDSMVYTYNGIKKFMSYLNDFLNQGKSLNQPIDNFLDTYFNLDPSFIFLWVHPTICVQGSEYDIYKTTIQISD